MNRAVVLALAVVVVLICSAPAIVQAQDYTIRTTIYPSYSYCTPAPTYVCPAPIYVRPIYACPPICVRPAPIYVCPPTVYYCPPVYCQPIVRQYYCW
ncbi:hypothetical protein KJ996_02885 [Patescibacteria group bacterium]|nr:hypothetical protein [Patescibacteria group bacterium]